LLGGARHGTAVRLAFIIMAAAPTGRHLAVIARKEAAWSDHEPVHEGVIGIASLTQ
jgi:hypothetical protein